MRKNTVVLGILLVLTVVVCTNAFAGESCAMSGACSGFWNSLVGFFHNAMPWNWGSWMGK